MQEGSASVSSWGLARYALGVSPTMAVKPALNDPSEVAPTAVQADALSTGCFVMGPELSLALIRKTHNIDAFFVLKSGETVATPGFPLCQEESRV